jgi:prepilin-type N-terminal cleavage/methylation domain-containing protein
MPVMEDTPMRSAVFPLRRSRRGFTLVELLTVIAIIAVLAAIIFPVTAVVRDNVRKGHCMSNIKDLIRAAQMYKNDHGVYPDALFALSVGDAAITPDEYRLFPDFVKDRSTFVCPNHPPPFKASEVGVNPMNPMTNSPAADGFGNPLFYAQLSSYDVQYRPNAPTGTPLLNYARKWTPGAASLNDDRRQLVYKNPPDDTVVTWCLYHSAMNNAGEPARSTMAMVGFLNGRVQALPADKFASWPNPEGNFPWQVRPKP